MRDFSHLNTGDEVAVDRRHSRQLRAVQRTTETRVILNDGTVWSKDTGCPVPRQHGFNEPRLISLTPSLREEIHRQELILLLCSQRSEALGKLTTEQLTAAATALGWKAP